MTIKQTNGSFIFLSIVFICVYIIYLYYFLLIFMRQFRLQVCVLMNFDKILVLKHAIIKRNSSH